ncbi:MAG: glycoside hydrolase family 3 N-terminal domain-containing protein [Phototrophicaceae bacterium]
MKLKTILASILCLCLFSTVSAQETILPYQDPSLDIEARVADLLGRMSLEEKFGQMTLIEKGSINPDAVTEYYIGAVLSGGGGYPTGDNSPEGWLEMVHGYQDAALATPLAIPMLYGVDAVHGHSNLSGAVIFPHNIGLGATRNPELIEEIGRITASEMIATGIYWNYAPVLAVPQDIRWGRTYEGYSENTALVTELSTAMLLGLQGDDLANPLTVLGTPKHFVGDGGTAFGTSPQDGAFLDRGLTDIDEATLREIHLAPYYDAIENGVRSIMISYSSWGDGRMHGQSYLINDVLREEMGFEGFIVSDWQGIDDVADSYYDSVVQAINAGIDMNMVPYDYVSFIDTMTEAVANGDITLERLDEAVANILRVKFELGLFENPYGDASLQATIGSDEHRAVAREAVSQSMVLLKNENDALPLDANAEQTIFIAGQASNNLGVQAGGWTIEWQGMTATLTEGTTIRQALEDSFGDTTDIRYSRLGRFNDDSGNPARADIGIVVVGEDPYAEWFGDTDDLALSSNDLALINNMRNRVDKLIVILISGRPMVINEALNSADAFVAVWLPGTEGNGVTDVLLGEQDFVGQLSFTWLRNNEQLPFDFANLPMDSCDAPLFPYGYGLSYADNSASESWLALSLECAPE